MCTESKKKKKSDYEFTIHNFLQSNDASKPLFFMRAHTEPEGTWVNEENWPSSRYPLSLTGISGLIKPGKAKQAWLC